MLSADREPVTGRDRLRELRVEKLVVEDSGRGVSACLDELERARRTQGEALSDAEMQRISSFLKSYAEMRKGEQFVLGEVRARARERIRWSIAFGLLALALLLAPLPWRRLRARLSRHPCA